MLWCRPCHVFSCFLAVLLELNNPGYSHYKSCCLDLRPQTGDRLCNLVSFSIPLGFTGRCLTLLAGYLLATLKATFFAYLSIRHTHIQCVYCRYKHTRMPAHRLAWTQKKDVPYVTAQNWQYGTCYQPFLQHCPNPNTFWGKDRHP